MYSSTRTASKRTPSQPLIGAPLCWLAQTALLLSGWAVLSLLGVGDSLATAQAIPSPPAAIPAETVPAPVTESLDPAERRLGRIWRNFRERTGERGAGGVEPPAGELVESTEEAAATDHATAEPTSGRVNLQLPTTGGWQFWTDYLHHTGWRIQQNAVTGHFRLLDDRDRRYAWGTWEECRREFDRQRIEPALRPVRGKVVICLHGLGRTRNSMSDVAEHLAPAGDFTVINLSYASTRRPIAEHAEALASVLEFLPEVEEINFVAHSLGNLVIRHYWQDELARPAPHTQLLKIRRIVMLGPPNNGAQLASTLRDNRLFQLLWGQPGVTLARDFDQLQQRLATPSCEFGIIAGSGERSNPWVEGEDDLVVSVEETRLRGATDFLMVPVSHSFIMQSSEVLDATARFLRQGHFRASGERQPIE